jgi:hypothetical protein
LTVNYQLSVVFKAICDRLYRHLRLNYHLAAKIAIMKRMGFESWTLWGMALAAFGALIAIGLALIAQSPRLLKRTGLAAYQLEMRARQFTGYGFALLLLAIGFFLAGVPLEGGGVAVPLAESGRVATPDSDETEAAGAMVAPFSDTAVATTTPMPASGAFDAPPPTLATAVDPQEAEATEAATAAPGMTAVPTQLPAGSAATTTPTPNTVSPTSAPTATATPTTTPTPTNTPTVTPTPSLTPAPVSGPTALVRSGGNSVWVRRMPGGQALVMVRHNDTLVILSGRANQGGILWQEISTLDGIAGWIPAEFLRME